MNIREIFLERDGPDLPVATFHDGAIPNTTMPEFAQASPARWLLGQGEVVAEAYAVRSLPFALPPELDSRFRTPIMKDRREFPPFD